MHPRLFILCVNQTSDVLPQFVVSYIYSFLDTVLVTCCPLSLSPCGVVENKKSLPVVRTWNSSWLHFICERSKKRSQEEATRPDVTAIWRKYFTRWQRYICMILRWTVVSPPNTTTTTTTTTDTLPGFEMFYWCTLIISYNQDSLLLNTTRQAQHPKREACRAL